MKILYKDNFILIADKPAGLPVHRTLDPKRKNFTDDLEKELGLSYLRTVNRLDVETSGIVVFGLNPDMNKEIDSLMELSEKYYICIVKGVPEKKEFRIESFLKDGKGKVISVRSGGKKAITEFKVLASEDKLSIVECKLITGRRHQIRIHLSEAGFSILGDKIYGDGFGSKRCLLHSWKFNFQNLESEKIEIISEIPADFKNEKLISII